jgi:putative heme iron utilization protein
MTPEENALLKDLLNTRRVLSLSVLLDGEPYIGLLPFAIQPDFSAMLVHASSLARHTKGLSDGAPVGFMVHALDQPDADPLQLPRLSLQGTSRMLDKKTGDYAAARDVYVARFPSSEMVFSLGDFNLYELVPKKGRFVIAFGRAFNVTADTLRELA